VPPHAPHLAGGEKHENDFANRKFWNLNHFPKQILGRQIKVWQSNQKYPKRDVTNPKTDVTNNEIGVCQANLRISSKKNWKLNWPNEVGIKMWW
jgi:hypothetical protein